MLSQSTKPLFTFLQLGLRPYSEVLTIQKDLQQKLISGEGHDTLIVCEHPPVITMGTSAKRENILLDDHELNLRGVELYRTGRGGDVTFHGPGQLVAYPILNLNNHKRDVAWYLRNIEQVIIDTLTDYSISGFKIEGKTGVWTKAKTRVNNGGSENGADLNQKIASIGVRISRWCTMHGLALNVQDCTSGFELINPCGFKDIGITSLEQNGVSATVAEVSMRLLTKFKGVFSYD